jgi:hypothetical protein
MRASGSIVFYGLAALVLCVPAGCGDKVDEAKPMEKVRAEAQKMTKQELRIRALAYKGAIEATQKLVWEYSESYAPKGEAKYEAAQKSLAALKERFRVYCDKLKEKGGSLPGLEI